MAGNANFATWNRLANVNPSLSYSDFILDKGNTRFRGNTGGTASMTSTISMTSGKWYIEFYVENNPAGGWPTLGLTQTKYISELQNVSNYQTSYNPGPTANSEVIGTNGNIKKWGASSSVSSGSGWSNTDIVQIAYDGDSGKWWFGKNNTWYASGNPATGANPIDTITAGTELSVWTASYNGSSYLHINAGQDDTFNGNVTAAGNADDNGYGAFKYSPPSGYLALCSANMSISSDIDPAGDDGADENPTKQFGVVTYTGNATTGQAITGLGCQPDLVWAKMTSSTQANFLSDTSRGINKFLFSDATSAEGTGGGYDSVYSSFDSDGFTFSTSGSGPNDNGATYVAWGWKANGGVTSSNSNGSITSTVQANTKAGFSIATYTSPNSSSNQTVGHGLSGVDFVITKNRDATFNWYCFHSASSGKTYRLNSGSEFSYSNWSMGATTWGSENGYTHDGTSKFVAYAWQNVEGMQKFGSYEGSGNTDGPFVYTGFRPRLIFTLLTNSSSGWRVRDTARDTFNPSDKILWWNLNYQQYSQSGYNFDILSNGFKIRNSGSDFNSNGLTYLYGAWGDVPFKYNNTF